MKDDKFDNAKLGNWTPEDLMILIEQAKRANKLAEMVKRFVNGNNSDTISVAENRMVDALNEYEGEE